jgi:hypothetical protein
MFLSPISTGGYVLYLFFSAYCGRMSTKHVRTTGDLVRFGCALRVECTHCHSARTFSGAAAVASLRLVELRNVAKRFRCVRCGMKAAKVMVLPPV